MRDVARGQNEKGKPSNVSPADYWRPVLTCNLKGPLEPMQPTGQTDQAQEQEGGQAAVDDHPEQAIEPNRNVNGWDGFASEDSIRNDDLDDGEREGHGSDAEYIDMTHAEEEDAEAVSVCNHFR